MQVTIGNCGKHPGNNMINCPLCAIEQFENRNKISMKNINIFVGNAIYEKRKVKKMTQQDVADALDVSRVTMVNIESGRQGLSIENLCKLCVIFDCSASDFLPKYPKFKTKKVVEEKVITVERTQYEWEDFKP